MAFLLLPYPLAEVESLTVGPRFVDNSCVSFHVLATTDFLNNTISNER